MSVDDRRVWIDAAFSALRHLPIDAIEKGAAEAQRTADHPSKIVPTIVDATRSDMAWRHRQRVGRPAPTEALPSPERVRGTESELDTICKRYGVGRYSQHNEPDPWTPAKTGPIADGKRPSRTPTREDYIRMGVDPATLDSIDP